MIWLFCGLLNFLPFIGSKKLLCWDIFVEYKNKKNEGLKKKIASFVIKQYLVSVVWSQKQVKSHADYFDISEDFFIFFPYKSNHSQRDSYDLPLNNFIFAGGNGKRDYKTLIEAVRGTTIPVVISATAPEVRKQIENLPNVVVLGAPEPAFAQLQAASRFVVVPMTYTGLKGGGEANFCNAMWHKKPIIAVDSMAASDYVLDGCTGYVVESGDVSRLKEVIHYLWNSPEVCERYGQFGRKHVETNFTHELFIQRLLRLAQVVGSEKL